MLSGNWQDRKPRYDVVIVGSGYGGAITAARLATAELNPKPSICILERGREWPVGAFPDTLPRWLEEVRSDANPLGLYEMLNFRDISVVKGSGLGGTSLLSANVALVPDEETFGQAGWPRSLTRDALLPYYRRALAVLDAGPHPRVRQLAKFQVLDLAARAAGARAEPLDLAVNFRIEGENPYGVQQVPCIDCGDCFTGCNLGAKNTLCMNYLPIARRAGAEIYTQTKVEWVEKLEGGGWRLHGRYYRDKRSSEPFTLEARNVILAAGSLNSTEILLRSEMHGLRVSPRLGSGFSGNGDFYAVAYNSDFPVQALGFGNHPSSPRAKFAPGPTILGVLRREGGGSPPARFVIEDAVLPSAFVRAAQLSFAAFRGEDSDTGDEAAERRRVLQDLSQADPYSPEGALYHTLVFLVMSLDNAKGTMEFEAPWWEPDGRMKIVWDDAGRQQLFRIINEDLRRHTRALGATFVENAVWTAFDLRRLITLHPLGGCPVGEDYLHGAVDEYGRLFSGDGSAHEGLFVADGALVPSALGVNPFITICALAERIAERKVEELQGRPYAQPNTAVSMAGLDPLDYVGASDGELEKLFRRSGTLGIERLVNTGERRIDIAGRRIYNDAYWKGFLPKGLSLGELAARLFTGYNKRFWRDGSQYFGETQYFDQRIALRHSLEEITLTTRVNNLDPGRYVLLRYLDPPFDIFYDVMKIVNDNLIVYRGYTGQYPNGLRGFTACVVRTYSFDQMTVADHAELFRGGTVPTQEDLDGAWRLDVIANANHAGGIAWLQLDRKPDGRLESRYQPMGLIEGLVVPRFALDHFRLDDFTAFHEEIRKIDDQFLVGKWVTELPDDIATLFPAGSVGLYHVEEDAAGKRRFGFYYLLRRVAGRELPANTLLDPLLEVKLPDGVGMSFDEEMTGWFFPGQPSIPQPLPDQHTTSPGALECGFQVSMMVRDVNEFVDGAAHEARLKGSIRFERFEGEDRVTFPLDEKRSFFNYLIVNAETREAEMRYHLEFRNHQGRRFTLEGRKYMQKDEPAGPRAIAELLEDYTTLYAHLYEEGEARRDLGAAWLKFRTFEDLAAAGNLAGFLQSFRITGTDNALLRTQARLKFLAFTARFVQREYDPLGPAVRQTGAIAR